MIVLSVLSSHSRGMGHFFRTIRLAEIAKDQDRTILIIINNHLPAVQILKQAGIHFRCWNNEIEYNNICQEIYKEFHDVTWINDKFKTHKAEGEYHKRHSSKFLCIEDRGAGVRYCHKHFIFLPWDSLLHRQENCNYDLNILPIDRKMVQTKRKRSSITNILVSLGGSDTYSITPTVAEALRGFSCNITIILGPGSDVTAQCGKIQSDNIVYKQGVDDFVAELVNADLLITGGGMTHLEGVSNGLPSLIIAMEEHEIVASQPMCSTGASLLIGFRDKFLIPDLSSIDIASMSDKCLGKMLHWSTKAIDAEFF